MVVPVAAPAAMQLPAARPAALAGVRGGSRPATAMPCLASITKICAPTLVAQGSRAMARAGGGAMFRPWAVPAAAAVAIPPPGAAPGGGTRGSHVVRRRLPPPAAAGEVVAAAAGGDGASEWDTTTNRLIDMSTVGFLFLMLPQILKNAGNLAAGNAAALSILPWMGYTTGLLGNLLLLTYFAGKKERGATIVQAVGVVSTAFLVTQIFIAGHMPPAAFWPGAALITTGLLLNVASFRGALSGQTGQRILGAWQGFIGLVGVAVLPGIVWNTFSSTQTLLPGIVGVVSGAAFLCLESLKLLPKALQGVWGKVSAWAATLLFMFMPVAQLRANFVNPASLEGISLVFVLLATASNGLMVPRALLTKDIIWLTGCTWGSLMMGWAQLLSMYLGRGAAGARYLPGAAFWGLSAAFALYYLAVLVKTNEAQGGAGPASPIKALFNK